MAAQTGDGESQYALAILYEYGGETVERNADKAALWFEKAAKKKVAGACLVQNTPQNGNPDTAGNHTQNQQIDMGPTDLPVGAVQAQRIGALRAQKS